MENTEIIYGLKPADVPFAALDEVIKEAYGQEEKETGVYSRRLHMSADDLEAELGPEAVFFTAMRDGEVVGTLTLRFQTLTCWYHQGPAARLSLIAVRPASTLMRAAHQYASDHGCQVMILGTQMNNKRAQRVYEHLGYLKVRPYRFDGLNVEYALWTNGCPIGAFKRKTQYALRRVRLWTKK